jgi:hypothetical protein
MAEADLEKWVARRWKPLRLCRKQWAFRTAIDRGMREVFAFCGRRSCKSELAHRVTVLKAIGPQRWPDTQYFLAAPTHKQAKDLFWSKTVRMIPKALLLDQSDDSISHSDLSIRLWHGGLIRVSGLDKPERVEGGNEGWWDGGAISEYPSCKPEIIQNIRPMMARGGWCIYEGTPEGRGNHAYQDYLDVTLGKRPKAESHHWTSEETLHLFLGREAAADEIRAARARMDARTYGQEYRAEWVSYAGLAYYMFDEDVHAAGRIHYDPELPLQVAFDFNSTPGVAAIMQIGDAPEWLEKPAQEDVIRIIDEVYIPQDSTSRAVAGKIAEKWGSEHRGEVYIYGDAAGGAKLPSANQGTDWDNIRDVLEMTWEDRVIRQYPRKNPPIRVRVNAVNRVLENVHGEVGLVIDPKMAPYTVRDFQAVESDEAGDLIKEAGSIHSHLTDAIGYATMKISPPGGVTEALPL